MSSLGPIGSAPVGAATSSPGEVFARPTVTSILPRTGHTGGDTFVEIKGSGFALPPPPPAKGKVTAPLSRVRVLFGDTPCERVEVAADGLLYCWTPVSDPIDRVTAVTANPTTNRLVAPAHGIPNGTRCAIRLRPSGSGAPPVGALPAPLDSRAALFAVGVTANDLQVAASRGGAPINLEDAGEGTFELVWYGPVAVTVQNLAEQPAELFSGPAPFGIAEGDDLHVLVGDEAQVITVGAGEVALGGAATAPELARILSRLRGARADVHGTGVRVRTDVRGPTAAISVEGGTAAAAIDLEQIGGGPAALGSTDLVPVDEEAITIPDAYTFTRPDLAAECLLATTIRALLRGLKREVLANVHMATDTDYDAETGDLVNTTYLAELPAIVLTNLRLPTNTDEAPVHGEEEAGATEDTFIARAPAEYVDVRFTLVAAAEDPVEHMNLLVAVRSFFRKHGELVVGLERHEMLYLPEDQTSIAIGTDNPNASSATAEVVIRRVDVSDMRIADQADLPEGVAPGTRYEGVRDLGWVQEGETNLETEASGA